MILKLRFYGISPLGLRNTQMGLGAKMGTVFWFVFSDALFWLQNRFSGWSTLCLLADQTICFSSIRFVTYGPCFLLICLCGNSVGTTKESQRHPDMPYFVFSMVFVLKSFGVLWQGTGLSGMALMKSSEQLEPLSLSVCLGDLFHREKHHGEPVRGISLR